MLNWRGKPPSSLRIKQKKTVMSNLKLIPVKSKLEWNGTFRVSKTLAPAQLATAVGSAKFLNVTTTCPDGYFVVDMTYKSTDGIDGGQTRKVVSTIFAESLQGKNIIADLDGAEGTPHRINLENGVYGGFFVGDFYDVPLNGQYKTSFTPEGSTVPIDSVIDEVSVFIFHGDSLAKAFKRAQKRVEKDTEHYTLIESTSSDTDAAAIAEHLAGNQ
jgi:hypothetical protein